MPKKTTLAVSTKWNFLGPPCLLPGEDLAVYDELLARLSGSVKASDIIEEIWVRDIVDLSWEVSRLRRLKTDLIAATTHEGLQRVLQPLSDWSSSTALSQAWAKRDANAIKAVEGMLASAELKIGRAHV